MCYKLNEVWLCKLCHVVRKPTGIMELLEFEPVYLLIESKQERMMEDEEVPEYKCVISGGEFFDGVDKGVFGVRDLDKVFVTEKMQLPFYAVTPNEVETGKISEERLISLYKQFYNSRLMD